MPSYIRVLDELEGAGNDTYIAPGSTTFKTETFKRERKEGRRHSQFKESQEFGFLRQYDLRKPGSIQNRATSTKSNRLYGLS